MRHHTAAWLLSAKLRRAERVQATLHRRELLDDAVIREAAHLTSEDFAKMEQYRAALRRILA